MIPAEQGKKAGVPDYRRIADDDSISRYFQPDNLIEIILKDGRIISLIHKYLNAGVMEDGGFHATEEGVPQGGLCGAPHNPPYADAFIMLSQSA